ncbi:MAG: hypothetical protein SNH79_04920 [Rikenellaceae bacterium]
MPATKKQVRKDPFPAATATSGTTSAAWLGTGSSTWDITDSPYKTAYASGGNTTAMAVNNPMAFYYRTSSAYGNNWCSEAQATTYLWNDIQAALASGKKSIFDPSPAGWKLPTITADSSAGTPWYGLTANLTSSVATFFTNAKYPASGARYYSSGEMNYVGTNGRCGSASPSSETTGYNLRFYSSTVYPANNSHYRSNGYQVRPVLE